MIPGFLECLHVNQNFLMVPKLNFVLWLWVSEGSSVTAEVLTVPVTVDCIFFFIPWIVSRRFSWATRIVEGPKSPLIIFQKPKIISCLLDTWKESILIWTQPEGFHRQWNINNGKTWRGDIAIEKGVIQDYSLVWVEKQDEWRYHLASKG